MKKLNQKDYIGISNNIHNNKYDYSKTVFVNMKSKIKIICPSHGEFLQNASSHKRGSGCPKCVYNKLNKKATLKVKLALPIERKIK